MSLPDVTTPPHSGRAEHPSTCGRRDYAYKPKPAPDNGGSVSVLPTFRVTQCDVWVGVLWGNVTTIRCDWST